jgi:tight adherence protein B
MARNAIALLSANWLVALGILVFIAIVVGVVLRLVFTLRDDIRLNRRIESLTGRVSPEETATLLQAKQDRSVDDTILRILPSLHGVTRLLRQAGFRSFDIKFYVFTMLAATSVVSLLYDNPMVPPSLNLLEPISTLVLLHAAIGLPLLRMLVGRRKRAIMNQLSAAISHVSRSLQVGQSPDAAIALAAESCESPLADELAQVVHLNAAGISVDAALRSVAKDIDLPEFDFFVSALEAQARSGGSIVHVLQELVGVIRARAQLKMKIDALTAEGKMSAGVLTLLPLGIFGWLCVSQEDYVAPLFEPGTGHTLLGVGFGLIVVGLVVMMRIVKIKV